MAITPFRYLDYGHPLTLRGCYENMDKYDLEKYEVEMYECSEYLCNGVTNGSFNLGLLLILPLAIVYIFYF